MRRCTCFSMPCGKRMPQVVPPKIMNSSPRQGITSCLGVDLDDGISLIGEHMAWVVALSPLQHIFRRLIQRHRMRPAVFVLATRHPQMARSKLICFHCRRVTLACLSPVASENCAMSARCCGSSEIRRSYSAAVFIAARAVLHGIAFFTELRFVTQRNHVKGSRRILAHYRRPVICPNLFGFGKNSFRCRRTRLARPSLS